MHCLMCFLQRKSYVLNVHWDFCIMCEMGWRGGEREGLGDILMTPIGTPLNWPLSFYAHAQQYSLCSFLYLACGWGTSRDGRCTVRQRGGVSRMWFPGAAFSHLQGETNKITNLEVGFPLHIEVAWNLLPVRRGWSFIRRSISQLETEVRQCWYVWTFRNWKAVSVDFSEMPHVYRLLLLKP